MLNKELKSDYTLSPDKMRMQALDLLRFPLACVIVFIHVCSYYLNEATITPETAGFSITTYLTLFARCFLNDQSVPIYYFIAGYVFFRGGEFSLTIYKNKLRNRYHSLLIPYIYWNIIAIIIALIPFFPIFANYVNHDNISLNFDLPNILNMFWDYSKGIFINKNNVIQNGIYPIDVPLWFVQDLLIIVATIPVLYFLIKKFKLKFVMCLTLLWYILPLQNLGFLYQLITAYSFFSIGAYLSIERIDMIKIFKNLRLFGYLYPIVSVILIIYAINFNQVNEIYCYGFRNFSVFIKNLGSLSGCVFAYNTAIWSIEKLNITAIKTLASSSFFIYSCHWIFMPKVMKLMSFILKPNTDINALFLILISFIILTGGILMVYIAMKKYLPSVLKPFVGGRL